MTFTVATFDIGSKNFAFCVEEFDSDKIKGFKRVPKTKRYVKETGLCSEEFQPLINSVYEEGKILLLDCVDLTEDITVDSSEHVDPQIFVKMTECLESHKDRFWDNCDFFIIERQLKENPKAQRLEQHVFSYFSIMYGLMKHISTIPASRKTQVLGAPKKMTKYQRKKWAAEKMLEIVNIKGDDNLLIDICSRSKKNDDIGDCVLMAQVVKISMFVDGNSKL